MNKLGYLFINDKIIMLESLLLLYYSENMLIKKKKN